MEPTQNPDVNNNPVPSSAPPASTPPTPPAATETPAPTQIDSQPNVIAPNAPPAAAAPSEPDFVVNSAPSPDSSPATAAPVTPSAPTITPIPAAPDTTETPDRPQIVTPTVITSALADMDHVPAAPTPAVEAPDATSPTGPVVVTASPEASVAPAARFTKKKLLMAGGLGVVLIALIGGLVFGLYLPNTPSGIWNSGINRTGKAVDGVILAATEPKKLETYKTSDISGTVTAKMADTTYSGDFNTKFDQTSQDGGFNFTLKDSTTGAQTLNAKVLSEIPAGSNFPDVYFQLTGLKSLGLDSYLPGISKYDGKWILVGSDYLKSIGSSYLAGSTNNAKQLTTADISEVARAASSVTKDYLLSTNADKAVLVRQSFVGKEKLDGLSTYHYKVGINIAHAKAYCVAISNSVLSTNAYKKLSGSTADEIAKAKTNAAKDCPSSVDNDIKASDSFDVWIDAGHKLVYKFRAYDTNDKGSYTDVGQIYKGSDKLSLFTAWHSVGSKNDGKFTLDTDLATNTTDGLLTVTGTDPTSPITVKATFKAKAATTPVKITKPTNAIPIQDVLKAFGLDPAAFDTTGTTGTSSSI